MEDELKIELDEHIQDSERHVSRNPDHFVGPEPWQLRPGEAGQLRIDLARYPRMLWAWNFFEAFIGLVHPNDLNLPADFFDDERRLRADILKLGMTPQAFTAFATHYAALTPHEAKAMYARMDALPDKTSPAKSADSGT